MKPINFSDHALERCQSRGASQEEVIEAIQKGIREPAKKGRILCRINFEFNQEWMGVKFSVKQVAPVIIESEKEIVVVTVFSFYF